MQYMQRYNSTTEKYDTFYNKWWYWPYAGYYLAPLRACASSAMWSDVVLCQAGGYCPGETSDYKCENGNSPENYGLYVCGDNSYSDAGAAACTPCPAGTGNSGDDFASHAGAASCQEIKCSAGQYLGDDGYTCVPCDVGYYCPGDNEMHVCGNYDTPYYADERGLSACKKCPLVDEEYKDGVYKYWYWIADEGTPASYIHVDRAHCRAVWERTTPHGYIRFSCLYNNDGYSVPGGNGKCMTMLASTCDAGYYIDTTNPVITQFVADGRIRTSSYDDMMNTVDFCVPVGPGYYSPADSVLRTACDAGTFSRIDTATSATECDALCTAGVTEFHAGDLTFNIYRDKPSSPALNIRITDGGPVCYVPLAPGVGTNAVNIEYDNKTYHTIF